MSKYIFINQKIAKYKRVIKSLHIVSIVLSVLIIISQVIEKAVTGRWNIWEDIESEGLQTALVLCFIIGVLCMPIAALRMLESSILSDIDCARISECVNVKSGSNPSNINIKILDSSNKFKICFPIISDIAYAFFYAMCCSGFFTNGYFVIIFTHYLGSFIVVHICSYITIIFYVLCCNVKKKELRADLQEYIKHKKKEMQEKQKEQKITSDKNETRKLLEQCGMKFFLKYYEKLTILPLRDIDVVEDYSANERMERLSSAKTIIDNGHTKLAIDYILQNYSTVLSKNEIDIATKINETL